MEDYSDLPEWLLEQYPDDGFVDALLECTGAVIDRFRNIKAPLLGLALDIQPQVPLIELSLLFEPSLGNRSMVTKWDRYHITASPDFTKIWQPVRDAFEPERERWENLGAAHHKGGSLFIYTLLVSFVFNLDNGTIADALDRVPTARDMQVIAVNYEDPTHPNVFEVEHGRVTLHQLRTETAQSTESESPEREPFCKDPNQLELF